MEMNFRGHLKHQIVPFGWHEKVSRAGIGQKYQNRAIFRTSVFGLSSWELRWNRIFGRIAEIRPNRSRIFGRTLIKAIHAGVYGYQNDTCEKTSNLHP